MKALISVSDKTGIVTFAQNLIKIGFEIISTGGTYKVLKENGLSVTPINEVTEFPEILDGRVKTLNPKIHGGLLALRDNKTHIETCKKHNIGLIDLVVVNLYPFEKTIKKETVTLEEAIENIDIGGPTMLRSAAKNYKSVGVIVNPKRYEQVLDDLREFKGKLSDTLKSTLALEVFEYTARYDQIIAGYLKKQFQSDDSIFPEATSPVLTKTMDLRYGENPHQKAAIYRTENAKNSGLMGFKQLHGKALSFNNFIDLESAWKIVKEFDIPGAAIIKHTNPCGAAIGETLVSAYKKAHASDPLSAFGSIVGLNRTVDKETATEISKTFVEVIIAPAFDKQALEILTKKASLRLITLDHFFDTDTNFLYRNISGGFLIQEENSKIITKTDLSISTKTHPTQNQINDLLFAFSVVKHIKSNAILLVKDGQTIGVGAGQMSRVDAVEIALQKAGKNAKNAVLASDAFFPFKDSIELAAKAGITAIIQPGGSKRDQESIDCCNENNMAMAYTGIRHFKH